MFKTSLTPLITQLVDKALPRHLRFCTEHLPGSLLYKNAIIMELTFSVFDMDDQYNKVNELRDQYYVVFCGNMSVFYTQLKDYSDHYTNIPAGAWKNTSNHDSCWRSDGLNWISDVYFKMCKECNPNKAPIALQTVCNVGVMNLWEDVEVEIKRENNDTYFYNLINIKPVKKD